MVSLVGPALFAAIFGASAAASAAAPASFDLEPERQVLARLLGRRASQFELGSIESSDGHEQFRLSAARGHIRVDGSTPSAVLFGVNWYLNKFVKFVADYEETWFKGGSGTGSAISNRPIERVFDTRWQIAF